MNRPILISLLLLFSPIAPGVAASAPLEVTAPAMLIAHKGASTYYPENTLIAIGAAFTAGAESVEIDLRTSSDGAIVLMHDSQLERTTNGTGGVRFASLAYLKTLDAGSWKSPVFAGHRIPTLAEALNFSRGKGKVMLDIKAAAVEPVTRIVLACKFPVRDLQVAVWTLEEVAWFRAALPQAEIILVQYIQPATWDDAYFFQARAAGANGYLIDVTTVTDAFIADAHRHGLKIYPTTLNSRAGGQNLVDRNVDGIFSDNPKLLRGVDYDPTLQIRSYKMTTAGALTLTWRSVPGRSYEIDGSYDSVAWMRVPWSRKTATGILTSFTLTVPDHGFYRIVQN